MAKITDADFGKTAHVCKTCGKAYFVGLRTDEQRSCPACGEKLQVKVLTSSDTYLEKDERSM
jgi:DNA-directed RNA polymerase subunit RPC12/RpoP